MICQAELAGTLVESVAFLIMLGRDRTRTSLGIGLPLIFAPFDQLATTPWDKFMEADVFAEG